MKYSLSYEVHVWRVVGSDVVCSVVVCLWQLQPSNCELSDPRCDEVQRGNAA